MSDSLRLDPAATPEGDRSTRLAELNALPRAEAVGRLLACCAAQTWADRVTDARPYTDLDDLLAASDAAVLDLDRTDLAQALDAHPRIGQRAGGTSPESAWSRQEQAQVGDADTDVQASLREGNAAYEERFDHVFLIRASGRSAEEMLAALRERLGNDPDTEWRVVAEELRGITELRLKRMLQP